MKRTLTLFAAILLLAAGAAAQKLSYQAVVRNDANELVAETTVQVSVTVLNASNAVQYAETHANVQTNRNGLLSLMIGEGTPTGSATLADVVWADASVRTVITLPNSTTITSVTPVNSVPYALYADNVSPNMVSEAIANYIANHDIGGEDNVQADWNVTDPNSDAYIQHKPTIPTVPTNVSAFNNDANYVTQTQLNAANYITAADVPAQVNADWNATSGTAVILNKPDLATVATTGSYNDLSDKPTIPTVPEDVSAFNNDANYVTQTQLNAANYITATDVPTQVNADWNATSGAAEILNKPNLATVATTGNYNDLTDRPTIPTVPADVSAFNNDANYVTQTQLNAANYITAADVPAQVNADWNATSGTAEILNKPDLATVATTGSYNDLSDKPTIPTVPEDVSAFNNDAGYITAADIPAEVDPTVPAWAKAETKPTYDYAEIENTPEIPTELSDLTNDVGYLTNSGCDTVQFCDLLQIIAEQRALIDSLSECVSSQQSFINKFPYASDGKPCPGNETVTDVDGNVYNTVKIGTQCWMKENMKSTKKADGTPLTLNSTFFYPNNDVNNVDTYGYLYVWSVASTTQTSTIGICPNGWHLPTAAEWGTLSYYVGSYEVYYCAGPAPGKALASNTGWDYSSTICSVGCDDMGVNNSTGFSAYPAGGYTTNSHQYFGFGQTATFWQNDKVKDTGAGANVWVPASRSISYEQSGALVVGYASSGITQACSVRCLRN